MLLDVRGGGVWGILTSNPTPAPAAVTDPPREPPDDIPGAIPRWVLAFTAIIGLVVVLAVCVGICGNPFGSSSAVTIRAPRPATDESLMAVVGGAGAVGLKE